MNLKIHKEGWVYFISTLIIGILIIPFFAIIGVLIIFFSFYIFYFFRDPIRLIPDEDVIISPADGVVTYIGECLPPIEYDQSKKFVKISIFLNIFNVHVNRNPVSGIIKKIIYVHGKFINATLDKSSLDNERNIILIEKKNKEVFFLVQIAGLIARRIVCDVRENQEIIKGDRFGIIKFGSRVDLYLPNNYNVMVGVGQTVIGGETILSNPNNIKNILVLTKK